MKLWRAEHTAITAISDSVSTVYMCVLARLHFRFNLNRPLNNPSSSFFSSSLQVLCIILNHLFRFSFFFFLLSLYSMPSFVIFLILPLLLTSTVYHLFLFLFSYYYYILLCMYVFFRLLPKARRPQWNSATWRFVSQSSSTRSSSRTRSW